jgi:hypothetical protein
VAAFDLIELQGEDLRDEPLLKRKQRLAKILASGNHLKRTPGVRWLGRIRICRMGFQVQDFIGHGSYKTTQKYNHLTDEDRMAAAALGRDRSGSNLPH